MVSIVVDPQLDADDDAPPCAPPPSPEYVLRHDVVGMARSATLPCTTSLDPSTAVHAENQNLKLLGPLSIQQKMDVDPPPVDAPKHRPSIKRKNGHDVAEEWGKKLRPNTQHQPPPVVPFYLPAEPWR